VKPGLQLTPEYDPLLAKLMVHAADRPAAVRRLRRALDETAVGGLQTDLGFHRWLVDEPAFVSGEYDTALIAERWGDGPDLEPDVAGLVALAAVEGRRSRPRTRIGAMPAGGDGATWARLARREAIGE
jgi:acetyl/propionyl-CoA carboxylase alpha subunit